MIRYSLLCKDEHSFEGWFRNSEDFDSQQKRGLITCPTCGIKDVGKALMAPSVVTSSGAGRRRGKEFDGQGEMVPVQTGPSGSLARGGVAAGATELVMPQPSDATADVLKSEVFRAEFVEAVRRYRRKVVEEAEYVGPRLAEEARRIHHEESEARSIYGEASLEEARELVDEGIPVLPLPRLPEDEN